jgi:ribose 5-phosphate isomerase B
MVIYLGADHRGFALKEKLKTYLVDKGYQTEDVGNAAEDPADDYVDFGAKVGELVSRDPVQSRGILICGSGVGMDITANKFHGVRAMVGLSPDQVFDGRHDDDVNVLCLAANFEDEEQAKRIADLFLTTPFGKDEKYQRRLDKLSQIDHG